MATVEECPIDVAEPSPRELVRDLFKPDLAIYWSDFLLTIFSGHATFATLTIVFMGSWDEWWIRGPIVAALFIVGCLLYYRAVMFNHELAHHRGSEFDRFRLVWNLLCGIPFLQPSFTYTSHLDHHRRQHYGTEHDGEYLPRGSGDFPALAVFALWTFATPFLWVVRFALLSPVAWLIPAVRVWTWQRCSSLVTDFHYVRPLPGEEEQREIAWQEGACFLWIWGTGLATLLAPRGPIVPVSFSIAAGLSLVFLNAFRALAAHRWASGGEEMTVEEQLLDSVTYAEGGYWTELWAPVGLRYHALHHLLPGLPYHHLPEAHRRLMEELPEDAAYRQTLASSPWETIRAIL